jgi:hypothetical protein
VEVFGTFSGLKLNKDKTEAMWLGSNRNCKYKPLGIKWPDGPLKMLGIYLSYDQDVCKQKNFKDKLLKMKSIINMWRGRNLTMIGRAQIIKTFIISQLLFVSSALDVPDDIIKEVDNMIFQFIWNGKKAKIRRSILKKNIAEGGLKIPDFETMVNTSRIKWVSRLFAESETLWSVFLSIYLNKSGIHLNPLLFANYNIKSLKIKPGTLPNFYQKMLKIWSEVGDNTHDKHTFLWYNKDILLQNKSCFYEDLFQAGVWHVYDLYNEQGNVLPFSTFVNRGVKKTSMIRWMGLVKNTCTRQDTMNGYDGRNDDTYQPLITLKDAKVPLKKCSSSIVYMELLKQKIGSDICIPRVNKYLELDNVANWTKAYLRANRHPLDTRTKEFQFKFLHDILVNRYWLKKWGITADEQCQICKSSSDNLMHVYWECPSTRLFWSDFVVWCEMKMGGTIDFKIGDVFLGCDDETIHSLLLIAKRHIYCKRLHDEPPQFATFLVCVKTTRNTELYIARQNNTMDRFLSKWQNI